MPTEIVAAEAWIRATLLAANPPTAIGGPAAPRIYSHVVPASAALPSVIYQMQAAEDLMVINGRRVWADLVYVVQVVALAGAWEDVDAVADWMDAALHNGRGSYDGGMVYACTRERPFAFVEHDGDMQYRHLGGIYRLQVRS